MTNKKYKVRTELYKDGTPLFGNKESIENIVKYEKFFLCNCHGIGLTKRSPEDNHIILNFLGEDDGHWREGANGCSSNWIEEIQFLLKEVNKWLKNNCDPDMGDKNWNKYIQYGWKFKNEKNI